MSTDISRMKQAQELMAHPLMVEAREQIEQTYTDAWKATGNDEVEKRDRIWLMLKLAQKVFGHLETIIADGKLREREIDGKRGLFRRVV